MALPAEEVPPELPEPSLGINFARDGMDKKHWMSLVAAHTDSWLLYVAFYYGARVDRNGRYLYIYILASSLFVGYIATIVSLKLLTRFFTLLEPCFRLFSNSRVIALISSKFHLEPNRTDVYMKQTKFMSN